MLHNYLKEVKQNSWRRISQSEIRNSAAAESEGGPRRRNFVSLRGKQKFLLFACPVASRRLCYGARPSENYQKSASGPERASKLFLKLEF